MTKYKRVPFTHSDELTAARAANRSLLVSFMSWGPFHRVAAANITDQLVSLFPGQEITEERWGSCAVVASGAKLKGSMLGAVIDSHDSVLRFNIASVRGAEADVGSRTTHRHESSNNSHLALRGAVPLTGSVELTNQR